MKTINHNNRAFTLLELLVVLIIIGLLIAIAVPYFRGIIARARNTAIQSKLVEALTAANRFRELRRTFEGSCDTDDWRRIRHTIETEHGMTGRVHCIDSPHFVAVSSGLHGLDHYWVVDSDGRNSAGSSVRGLVGYWRFQERGGTIAYDSAGKSNAHFVGRPLWHLYALRFDGHSHIQATLPPGTAVVSKSAWILQEGGELQFVVKTDGVFWVNGVKNVTPAAFPIVIEDDTIYIGKGFRGLIDDVRVYNRRLM